MSEVRSNVMTLTLLLTVSIVIGIIVGWVVMSADLPASWFNEQLLSLVIIIILFVTFVTVAIYFLAYKRNIPYTYLHYS